MKIFIASDLHGSEFYTKMLINRFCEEKAERLILLGDLLYHGPRNDLPKDYCPKAVISMLNAYKDKILCVRGNCDAEVDQMVLEFPIMAEYAVLLLQGKMVYITHGHKPELLSMAQKGDTVLSGHTHIPRYEEENGVLFLNPGSVSIPKGASAPSYMLWEDGVFSWHTLTDGKKYHRI